MLSSSAAAAEGFERTVVNHRKIYARICHGSPETIVSIGGYGVYTRTHVYYTPSRRRHDVTCSI